MKHRDHKGKKRPHAQETCILRDWPSLDDTSPQK